MKIMSLLNSSFVQTVKAGLSDSVDDVVVVGGRK